MFLNFITTNAAAAATTFTRRTVGQRRMRPELERINGMARRMASTAANAQIPVIQKEHPSTMSANSDENSPTNEQNEDPTKQEPPPPQQLLTLELQQLLEVNEQKKAAASDGEEVSSALSKLYNVGMFKFFLMKIVTRQVLEPELSKSMIESASRLYDDCANNYNFIALHKEFGLPDNYFAWYRLTLLHVWMIMVRMQQSMEAYAYCYFRRQLATAFHKDKTDRYNVFYKKDGYAQFVRKKKFRELYYNIFMSSLLDYDEGFLGDDQQLAGAVWRSFYVMEEDVDIVHLNRTVQYIRATMHYLDSVDTKELLENGLGRWPIAEEIAREQQQKLGPDGQ